MDEKQDIALRYAVEHGLTVTDRKYMDDSLVAKAKRALTGNDLAAGGYVDAPTVLKNQTLEEMYAERPCDGIHNFGERKPAVCCQALEAMGLPHPWEDICIDSEAYGPGCGQQTCAREDCPKHHDHRPPAIA